MPFNADRAFEAQDGIIVCEGAGVFSGPGSPLGFQAPFNSVFRDSTSLDVWTKTGPGVNDWTLNALSDPFAMALFDDCTPLFDKDSLGQTTLLEECG